MSLSLAAAALGGSALSAGSSLLGGMMNYSGSKKLMEKQYELNKRYFDYVSDYNSPVNQMKRLEEAGLNKNLVYANGADNTQSAVGSVGSSSANFFSGHNFMNDLASYQSIVNQKATEENTKATTTKTLSDAWNNRQLALAQMDLLTQQQAREYQQSRLIQSQAQAQEMDNSYSASFGGSLAVRRQMQIENSVLGRLLNGKDIKSLPFSVQQQLGLLGR